VAFIDTAQAYGSGKSEEILGSLIHDHTSAAEQSKVRIQTKWFPVAVKATNSIHPESAPKKMLEQSLKRMRLNKIDCYLVHGHIHPYPISLVAKGLAECVEAGLTKAGWRGEL
jgi:aryl-alcohol dehydrogenase-like predicted oxidoreductase